MRVTCLQIHHLYSALFVLWLLHHARIAAGVRQRSKLASETGLVRSSDPLEASRDMYPSSHLQAPRRKSIRDATTDAPRNPVMIFQDRQVMETSASACAAMLDLYDHVEKYVTNNRTELLKDNKTALAFGLGSIQISFTVTNQTGGKIPRRAVSSTPTPEDTVREIIKELRNQVLRGFIGISRIIVFVNNLFLFMGVIAILGPHTRQRPDMVGLPEIVM